MENKLKKFKNIERGKFIRQVIFNLVKYAIAIFALSFLIYYLNLGLPAITLMALSLTLLYIRFNYYARMEAEMDILAIEIGNQFFTLDCAKKDYQVNYNKIEYCKIEMHEDLKKYVLLFRLKSTEELEWPKELFEGYYNYIPGVFDEDLFYIINQNKTLASLCKNYDEARSYLQYEQDLRLEQELDE